MEEQSIHKAGEGVELVGSEGVGLVGSEGVGLVSLGVIRKRKMKEE